jgi:hypothetical protein
VNTSVIRDVIDVLEIRVVNEGNVGSALRLARTREQAGDLGLSVYVGVASILSGYSPKGFTISCLSLALGLEEYKQVRTSMDQTSQAWPGQERLHSRIWLSRGAAGSS